MLKNRNVDFDLEKLLECWNKYKATLKNLEKLRHEQKQANKKISEMKFKNIDITELLNEMKKLSHEIKNNEILVRKYENDLNSQLLNIPNMLDEDVPIGPDPTFNKVVRVVGEIPRFNFQIKPHWEIAEKLDIIDFKRASKIAGSRFPLYKGLGARLEIALINFMLDVHTKENNYIEIIPPFLINSQSLIGTGQLPKFKTDLFKCEDFDYYLVPTAEVPLTNFFREEILEEEEFPKNFVAWTPCFRAEAGSWGKDTKGLIRQHQFNKVELVKFCLPENSSFELEKLVNDAEKILKLLELPYRVVILSSGDTGFAASKCYDIEVWFPFQNTYREISSCSNCRDFQARRINIKYRKKNSKKLEYVHTLNGSGVAVGRIFAAILENYQTEDGAVIIPERLVEYLGGTKKISVNSSHET